MIKSIPNLISLLTGITSFKTLNETFKDKNDKTYQLYINYMSSWRARNWFVFPAQYTLKIDGIQLMCPKQLKDLKLTNEISEEDLKKFEIMYKNKNLNDFYEFSTQGDLIKYLSFLFKLISFKETKSITDKTSVKDIELNIINAGENKSELLCELEELSEDKLKELLFETSNQQIALKCLRLFRIYQFKFSKKDSVKALELFKKFWGKDFIINFFDLNLCWLDLKNEKVKNDFKEEIIKKSFKSYDVFNYLFKFFPLSKEDTFFSLEDYKDFFEKFKAKLSKNEFMDYKLQYLSPFFRYVNFEDIKELKQFWDILSDKQKQELSSKLIANENILDESFIEEILKIDRTNLSYYLKRNNKNKKLLTDILYNTSNYFSNYYDELRIQSLILESKSYEVDEKKLKELFDKGKSQLNLNFLNLILENQEINLNKEEIIDLYEFVIKNKSSFIDSEVEELMHKIKQRKINLNK